MNDIHSQIRSPKYATMIPNKWGRVGSTGDRLYRIAGRGATHRVKSGKKVTGNDREFALAA